MLALPGGAPAEPGAAVGGGLARGDGGRGRAAAPRGGRTQGGGASGRRLPEASAARAAAVPREKDKDTPVRNGTNALPSHSKCCKPKLSAMPFAPKRRSVTRTQEVCKPVWVGGKRHPVEVPYNML